MGSTGRNRFTDYPGTPKGDGRASPKGGGAGGSPEAPNPCEAPVTNVPLDEVARCEYHTIHQDVPDAGTAVQVRRNLVKGRVAVETQERNELIGFLPTQFNHLRRCMEQGYVYSGMVVSSRLKPIPVVRVSLQASQ